MMRKCILFISFFSTYFLFRFLPFTHSLKVNQNKSIAINNNYNNKKNMLKNNIIKMIMIFYNNLDKKFNLNNKNIIILYKNQQKNKKLFSRNKTHWNNKNI